MAHRQWVRLGAGLCALIPSVAAANVTELRGDERDARYELVFEAPSECPEKLVFLADIHRRIGKRWLASQDEAEGTLAVVVKAVGERYRARLTLADRWDHVAFRALEGPTCDAVLSDLAVAAVAAIESRLGPQPAYWELGVAGGPDWRTGLLAWGGGALLGIRWPTSRQSVQLALGYWTSGVELANRVQVGIRLQLVSMSIDVCPFEPRATASISFPLCLGANGGVLLARHAGSSSASVSSGGWVALGLMPVMRWTQNDLVFQVGPRAEWVLSPHRLSDSPPNSGGIPRRETVHELSRFGFALFASLGVRLP